SAPTRTTTPTPGPATTTGEAQPPHVDIARTMATITHLAEDIGPRPATAPAYRAAAAYVERRLRRLGYRVRRQPVDTPAGTSWGIEVPAGTADNLIVTTAGFRPNRPHRVVGAHLDTVPQAPGAEDNASGVAGVLELARMAAMAPPPTPVVFIAFASEEPRGDGDDWHHFGSRHYVAGLPDTEQAAIM